MKIEITGIEELDDWFEERFDDDRATILLELQHTLGQLGHIQRQYDLAFQNKNTPHDQSKEVGTLLAMLLLQVIQAAYIFDVDVEAYATAALESADRQTAHRTAKATSTVDQVPWEPPSMEGMCKHCMAGTELLTAVMDGMGIHHRIRADSFPAIVQRLQQYHDICEDPQVCACDHAWSTALAQGINQHDRTDLREAIGNPVN